MLKKKKFSKKDAVYSLEIEPISKKEKISKGLLKDLRKSQRLPRHSRKSALIAIGANIVIPGLGNYYLERNKVGLALTALSILLIVVFLSPLFTLNSVGVLINPTDPRYKNEPENESKDLPDIRGKRNIQRVYRGF